MKCVFLYNRKSGNGRIRRKLKLVERVLKRRFQCVDMVETDTADGLSEAVRGLSETYDVIVFAGGDGTFHRVLQGAVGSKAVFGYLPLGTINDVARSLGIPRTVRGALSVIEKGYSAPLDCMKVGENRYAMYIAAAGIFTDVPYRTPQESKRAFGSIAYLAEGVKLNYMPPSFRFCLKCGHTEIEGSAVLAMVLNGRSVAGLPVNRDATMMDGLLEAVVIRQVEKPNFFQRLIGLFRIASVFTSNCRIRRRNVDVIEGSKISIAVSDGVAWDFDGEEGSRGELAVEVVPKAIRLFIPKK